MRAGRWTRPGRGTGQAGGTLTASLGGTAYGRRPAHSVGRCLQVTTAAPANLCLGMDDFSVHAATTRVWCGLCEAVGR